MAEEANFMRSLDVTGCLLLGQLRSPCCAVGLEFPWASLAYVEVVGESATVSTVQQSECGNDDNQYKPHYVEER
jgi:hypothetical protein